MKKITHVLAFIFISINLLAQNPKNLDLLSTLSFPGQTLAGCWHYNNLAGNEYALVGASLGIAIVDVTNPAAPALVLQTPGPNSLWHEVKVLGDYAYAVSEGYDPNGILNGLQIIDLRYLPDSAPTKFFTGDGAIFNQLTTAHTVTADGHYVYVNGHNINILGSGVLIFDVTDPWNPVYTGAITSNYCHDSYVRGDTLYSSEIYAGQFSIFDISDRTSPNLITSQATPSLFNHNAWLSDNGRYVYVTDEKTNAPMTSYDVSDFANITQLDTFYNGSFTTHEVHNVRVFNDYVICPSYGSQLTIVDASHPNNMIEVANHATGTSLCWDADPYTASGNIIATDMNSGILYVFGPTYQRACYLEGNVTDSITGISLNGVGVSLPSISVSAFTAPSGNYATGYADSGSYQVTFSKVGYVSKTFTVNLANGQQVTLDVQLVPVGAGISSLQADHFVSFPNPALNEITIQSAALNIQFIKVFDGNGKLVLSVAGNLNAKQTIDVSMLSSGKYTARIISQNEIKSLDFLKTSK